MENAPLPGETPGARLPEISRLRRAYHDRICENIVCIDSNGVPNIADKKSIASCEISRRLITKIPWSGNWCTDLVGQTAGTRFERENRQFLEDAFRLLQHLRPGHWEFELNTAISRFQQYQHLAHLAQLANSNQQLKTFLSSDYLIAPDITVSRYPVEDADINAYENILGDDTAARYTPFRSRNHAEPPIRLLHASISVKWTLRSDRAQNARTEALNLQRNRKGHTPKIVVITAEPFPGRIASIALGAGDIDCVYHFALPELRSALQETRYEDSLELLETLIEGERLRDISDLPFDLAI